MALLGSAINWMISVALLKYENSFQLSTILPVASTSLKLSCACVSHVVDETAPPKDRGIQYCEISGPNFREADSAD